MGMPRPPNGLWLTSGGRYDEFKKTKWPMSGAATCYASAAGLPTPWVPFRMKAANYDKMTFFDAIQHAVRKAFHDRAANVPVNDRETIWMIRYDCDHLFYAL